MLRILGWNEWNQLIGWQSQIVLGRVYTYLGEVGREDACGRCPSEDVFEESWLPELEHMKSCEDQCPSRNAWVNFQHSNCCS